jgi:hypothetical protein
VVEMKSRGVTVYQLTICHAELVSASYFDRDESKTLKQVQGDEWRGTNGG